MKKYISLFIQYAKILLNFVIKYDDEIIQAYKEIKKDGKITFSDFLFLYDLYKNSGFLIEEENPEEVFNAGALDPMPANKYKKLFTNQQKGSTCVPNAVRRVTTYNTGIVVSETDFFLFIDHLYKIGKLVKGKGMTFRGCLDEWIPFIAKNNGRVIKYTRAKIGGSTFKNLDRLGYARLIGGYITSKYLLDFKKDDVINDKYTWTEVKRYGHAFTEIDTEGAKVHGGNIVENYNERLGDANIYTNDKILEFIANGYFFAYGYFINLDEDVTIDGEPIKNKADYKAKEAKILDEKQKDLDEILDKIDLLGAKKMVEFGTWSGSNPRHTGTRQEIATMDYNLAVFIFKSLGREDLVTMLENGNRNT
jgi:hypothetical protein